MGESKPQRSIFDFLPPLPNFTFTKREKPITEQQPPLEVVDVEEEISHNLYRVYERSTSGQSQLSPKQLRAIERAAMTPTYPPRLYADQRKAAASSMSMPNSQEKTLARYNRNREAPSSPPKEERQGSARYDRNSPKNLAALKEKYATLPQEVFQDSSRVKIQPGIKARTFS